MAKNIIITPTPGGGTLPNIDFQGATSGTIKLEVRDDGSLLIGGGTETNILSLYDEAANPVRVPSISLEDSNASHHLKIVAGSNLTADRTFTLSTGDAARALDISAADVTVSSFGATLVDDADASTARTTLGLAIGTNVQAYSANLTTFAAIAPSANVQTILGAADYAAIRSSLGLVIGTDVQAYDADLTTWAGLTPSAFFQTLVDDADASTARATLGLTIGTHVQAYDADLTTWAGLTPSAFFQTLVDDADASTARATLGLTIGTHVQAYNANLTTYAGIAPSANVQTILGAADYAAIRSSLGLVIGTNVQAYDADLTTWAGLTPSAFFQTLVNDADAATARATLGLTIGTHVQAYDADLTTWAGLTPSANAQSLVTAADYSAMRTLLSLVPGTNVQAYHASLASIAGLTTLADKGIYTTASNTYATYDLTSVARTLLAQTTQANMRTTGLGLGTSATVNTGTSGATIPLLNGNNTWSGSATFSGNITMAHATQTSLILRSSAGTNGFGLGRSIGGADGNDFYLYDYANSISRMGIGNSTEIVFSGLTNSVVYARGISGYGAFYPQGSGTNSSYVFMGNVSNSERVRLIADNSRNFVISVDAGTTSNMLVNGTSGATTFTGGTNPSHVFSASSGYTVLQVNGATTGNAFILLSNTSNGERGRIYADNSRNLSLSTDSGSTAHFSISSAGVLTASGNTIWHAGNDGASSGLDADLLDGLQATAVGAGKQGIWIPAGAMWPRTTTGCAALAQYETTTNRVNIPYLAFDATTAEYAQFNLYSNKQFGTTTVTFVPVWMHPSTSTNFGVVWELAGLGRSNDDATENAFGTAVGSTDTGGTTADIYMGPESSAITIGGSFAAEDWLTFQINRAPANGSDTMAVDAWLVGIMLFVTTTANTDV